MTSRRLDPLRLRALYLLALVAATALVLGACDDGDGGDPDADTGSDLLDTDDGGDDTADGDTAEPDTEPDTTADTDDDTSDADMTATCGDDLVGAGEDCDGAELGGESCETQGFEGGTLACASDCSFDTSACLATVCGNDSAGGDELCDGSDLAGESCESLGQGSGTLACAGDCTFDTSACTGPGPVCGDDLSEGDEACDGSDLGGADCISEGFQAGTLECLGDCSGLDTAGCTLCGNGQIESGELCEAGDLGGADCTLEGFAGGTLGCASDCAAFDTSACTMCGNGAIDAGEQCDASALDGATCQSRGFDGGSLGCNADCTFDETACTSINCGNGLIETGEQCEGLNHGGTTCQSLGFDGGGGLVCRTNCTFDTNACIACGDNTTEGAEVCDGTDLEGQSCASRGFPGGTLGCTSDCSAFDESACVPVPTCGNDLREVGEFCDGTDLSGVRCQTLGYLSGTLACQGDCGGYDTSACVACAADPREEDDTPAAATPITAGTVLSDGTVCNGDADWFALTLGEGDQLDLDLLFTHADGDLELALHRPDGTLAAASTTGTNDEHVALTVPVGLGGTWTVRVYAVGNRSNDYTLDVQVTPFVVACPGDDLHEPNDDQPRGAPMTGGQLFSGILCTGDTLDWYRLDLHEGDTVTLDLDFVHADGNLDLFMYLVGDMPVASSTSSTDDEQILSFVVPPGMSGAYGVLVTGDPNTYTLALDLIPGSVCGDGVVEGGESCDGTNFDGRTCQTEGFVSGILQCGPSCQLDTSGCANVLVCPGDDPYEQNDVQAAGFALPPGGGILNGIVCAGDADYFLIAASPGQVIQAELIHSFATGDLSLQLLTSTGAVVRQGVTNSDTETVSYPVPSTALSPYALRVVGATTSASAPYTLQVAVTTP